MKNLISLRLDLDLGHDGTLTLLVSDAGCGCCAQWPPRAAEPNGREVLDLSRWDESRGFLQGRNALSALKEVVSALSAVVAALEERNRKLENEGGGQNVSGL